MPSGGQNAKPIALHQLRGTYRKDRHGKNIPRPYPMAPRCPSWASADARKHWRRLAPELEKLGLLTILDADAFGLYCSALSQWISMSTQIDREGSVIEDSRGGRKHPLYPALHAAEDCLRWGFREFGMTPMARSRMNLPEVERNDFDSLLD